MSISITTNVNSLIAQENLRVNSEFQSRTIQRLTSGYRINNSGDDAAGLAVANKFRSDTSELTQGIRNANDGLSTLEIVDGGLNNVSQMLDRLKTLATQSASATFTGDRTTLNNEFGALLSEIDRQAANVGLGTGAYGGRYNTDISVYVGGGGATQANSKVTISLSGASNRMDASGLGLSGTSVAAGGATKLGVSQDLSTATNFLSGTTSQAFQVSIAKSGQPAFDLGVTITGTASGISGADVVSQFNNALSNYGISASLAADGKVQFSGGTAFSMRATGATGTNQIITGAGNLANTSMYTATGATSWVNMAADTETLTFTVGGQSASVILAVGNANTIQNAMNTLNNNLNGMGIYAVKNAAGTGIDFQSAGDFDYAVVNSDAVNFNEGSFQAANIAKTSATDPTSGSGVTSAAEAAIVKITAAVGTLGLVQGKVGTAQNKLSYSIKLAQGQMASFSAAESRIRDTDVAAEAANLTKASVMQQASLAAMAQANSAPQAVLALLRG